MAGWMRRRVVVLSVSDSSMLSEAFTLDVVLLGEVAVNAKVLISPLYSKAVENYESLTHGHRQLGSSPEQRGVHEQQKDHASNIQIQIVNLEERQKLKLEKLPEIMKEDLCFG